MSGIDYPPGTPTPSVTSVTASTSTAPYQPDSGSALPRTGTDVVGILILALFLVVAGWLLVRSWKRPRHG